MHTISRAYLEVNNDDDVYVRIVSFVMQSKGRNFFLPNLISYKRQPVFEVRPSRAPGDGCPARAHHYK